MVIGERRVIHQQSATAGAAPRSAVADADAESTRTQRPGARPV